MLKSVFLVSCVTAIFVPAGQFQNSFPEVFEMTDYSITDVHESEDITCVSVELWTSKSRDTPVKLRFQMARQEMGRKKHSVMTKSLNKET